MMDKRTYVCLVGIILKAVSAMNKDMLTTVATHEGTAATTSRTERLTVSSTKAGNITTLQNGSASLSTFSTTVNITNFPTLPQSTHSPHTETSAITAEGKSEVTFPTESLSTNSTHQTTVEHLNVTTSATTLKPTVQLSSTAPLISSKGYHSVSAIHFPAEGAGLSHSDTILTIFFTIVLALTILGFIIYFFNKYRKRRDQFSHHPLYDTSFETVDRYATPDDTLVISGGLYDAPRISNSNMTVYDDDELQIDQLPFNAQPGQYRLQFLPGEKEVDFSSTYEGTFQIPPGGQELF